MLGLRLRLSLRLEGGGSRLRYDHTRQESRKALTPTHSTVHYGLRLRLLVRDRDTARLMIRGRGLWRPHPDVHRIRGRGLWRPHRDTARLRIRVRGVFRRRLRFIHERNAC